MAPKTRQGTLRSLVRAPEVKLLEVSVQRGLWDTRQQAHLLELPNLDSCEALD